jgi:hypothetical protein
MKVTSTGDSGACSLRGAIEAVEAGTNGGCGTVESPTTTIEVPDNTITLSTQLVIQHGNMAIVGNEGAPSQSVIHGGSDRVIEVQPSANVKIVGFTITGGHTPDGGVAPSLYTENVVGNGGGILNRGSLTLEHVVVTENHTGQGDAGINGSLEGAGGAGGRGGSGGGIFNDLGASLVIVESTITKNFTGNGGRGGDGGAGVNALGHFPDGGDGGNGGPAGDGGGIYNAGSLYVEGSTVSDNFTGRGGEGGAGHVGTGEAAENGLEFSPGDGGDGGEGGNSGWHNSMYSGYREEALKGGGGIYNGGSLTMIDSTISGNATGAGGTGGPSGAGGGPSKYGRFADSGRAGFAGGAGRGGGLFSASGYGGHSPVSLTNVTIYGNRTGDGGAGGAGGGGAESSLGGAVGGAGGDGGGIWAEGASSGSAVMLTNVTIAGNELGAGGPGGASPSSYKPPAGERGVGAGIATGGRYDTNGYGVYEMNSIVAGNGSNIAGDANCVQRYLPTYGDIFDQGGNVTWNDTTCPGLVADPMLGTFGNHGGLTETLVPGSGSSAIGAVAAASCTVTEDQRGQPRPGTGKTSCDAGAVETQSVEPPPNEEKGGEQPGGEQPGGSNPGGSNPGGSNPGSNPGGTLPPPSPAPGPKPLRCRKGFTKKVVKGKPRCVKKKHRRHHHHHP